MITMEEKVLGVFNEGNWMGVEASNPNALPNLINPAWSPRCGVNATDIHHELVRVNAHGVSVARCGWTGSSIRPRNVANRPAPADLRPDFNFYRATFCLACHA